MKELPSILLGRSHISNEAITEIMLFISIYRERYVLDSTCEQIKSAPQNK